jgi:hypothetical protein
LQICYNKKKRVEKMAVIGVTGARKLTTEQVEQLKYELWELDRIGTEWHIGDAAGVDEVARNWVVNGTVTTYEVTGSEKWNYAERSTRMVKAIAAAGGTLHAWANKPAPKGLKPAKNWKGANGSGTWGTVALACGLGVKVELHWLEDGLEAPDWL